MAWVITFIIDLLGALDVWRGDGMRRRTRVAGASGAVGNRSSHTGTSTPCAALHPGYWPHASTGAPWASVPGPEPVRPSWSIMIPRGLSASATRPCKLVMGSMPSDSRDGRWPPHPVQALPTLRPRYAAVSTSFWGWCRARGDSDDRLLALRTGRSTRGVYRLSRRGGQPRGQCHRGWSDV